MSDLTVTTKCGLFVLLIRGGSAVLDAKAVVEIAWTYRRWIRWLLKKWKSAARGHPAAIDRSIPARVRRRRLPWLLGPYLDLAHQVHRLQVWPEVFTNARLHTYSALPLVARLRTSAFPCFTADSATPFFFWLVLIVAQSTDAEIKAIFGLNASFVAGLIARRHSFCPRLCASHSNRQCSLLSDSVQSQGNLLQKSPSDPIRQILQSASCKSQDALELITQN